MQLYFIRHGQSENNLRWEQTGNNEGMSPDPGLTETGQCQAQLLAQFLSRPGPGASTHDRQNRAGFGITHLYTSLMLRAVATATEVAGVLELPLVAWEDVHEWGGICTWDEASGQRVGLPGPNRAYFEAHYPALTLPETLGEAGWWNRPYEEREQRTARAQRVLAGLRQRHGGTEDRVAVVSHGGFYNYLLPIILKMPTRDGYWFSLNNAAITRVDFKEDEIVLAYLNRVDFLPPELIT